MSVCLSGCLLSVCLSVCPSVRLSVCLFVWCLSVSVCPFVCLSFSVCLSFCFFFLQSEQRPFGPDFIFSNMSDSAFKVSWYSFRVGVSSRRSHASEGCRGFAPAARASEMRRDSPDTSGFYFFRVPFFAFSQSREAVTESIGRDARVRENLDVSL